jgi:hypothetical protein
MPQLVKNNAEAWREYSHQLEMFIGNQENPNDLTDLSNEHEPKTLRAENLAGWINRVMKYMP